MAKRKRGNSLQEEKMDGIEEDMTPDLLKEDKLKTFMYRINNDGAIDVSNSKKDSVFFMCATWKLQQKLEDAVDCETNTFFAKHMPGLLDAIKFYVNETNTDCLNLSSLGLQTEHLKSILMFLQESQVTDLDLTDNSFKFGMKTLSDLFTGTKLKNVNISQCELVSQDVRHFMPVLETTQITHLDLSDNDIELSANKTEEFVFCLLMSHITVLNLRSCEFVGETGFSPFIEALRSTSITDLNLSQCHLSSDGLNRLFLNLQHTSITSLNLSENEITYTQLQPICAHLKNSKLKELDISCNELGDDGVNLLVENIPLSLVSLNLDENNILGKNLHLGFCVLWLQIESLSLCYNPMKEGPMFKLPDFVKNTTITILELGSCDLSDELGQTLIESLKPSKIIKLNVSGNKLQSASISKFAKIIEDTVIEDIDLSKNSLSPEAIILLGKALEKSTLKSINISQNLNDHEASNALSEFVAETRKTSVKSVNLSGNSLDASGARMIASSLSNSTLTHVDVSDNKIGSGVIYLAAALESSAITHLNLANNDIDDCGAAALAESLEGSQVIELNLNNNCITSRGTKTLAFSIKKSSLLSLCLENNQIENDGFESLAKQVEFTYFNRFEGNYNPGCGFILVEKVLWENRVSAHKLVSFFKLIAPETVDSENLCFDRNVDNANVSIFLKACAQLYQTVTEHRSAISVLAEEESLPFSRKQIATMLLKEFPKQFIAFVENKIKLNVTEFVNFLKILKKMELTSILQPLLLDPPVIKIDENLSVVHPLLYCLLSQYKQLSQFAIFDPKDKIKVIKYLSENIILDGATDMIGILCNEMQGGSS